MDETPQPTAMPKKACMISLMFEVQTDDEALAVKKVLDEHVAKMEKKKYTFQIVET